MHNRSSGDGPSRSPFGGKGDPQWSALDWDDLMPRLLLLASSRLARRHGGAPSMVEAEDFVQDAITKTMAGVRVWNREVCTLFQHLAGVIVSDISHSKNSSESRLTACPGRANGHTTWPPENADQKPSQEDAACSLSDKHHLFGYLSTLDPMMAGMAELMLIHDLWETRELSKRLEIAPAEVANLRKRLKRAVRAYLTEKRP
jgi:DNA-directed RNA polymerase specialized sigma24 family protein